MHQIPSLSSLGRVHLLGLGGVGVSGVARLLLAHGLAVSGTDAKDLPVLRELADLGARTAVGYDAANLTDADTVVVSSVIRPGNPEYDEAVRRGLRILHRSEALAAAMEGHHAVAVAGTHGKTTTTSLTAVMLRHAGASPSFAVGATIPQLGTNAELGSGRVFVAEADESDASFLNYRPHAAIVTNVEADHLDHYGTAEAVHDAFRRFAAHLPADGLLVACADDPGAAALAARLRTERPGLRVQTYGFSEAADRRLADATETARGAACTLEWGSGESVRLELSVPGRHNLLNAAAAFGIGLDCGLAPEDAAAGLAAFTGAARRFEFRGEAAGVRVYDDYAHHPTEVLAALRAARGVAGDGRVHVLFQPHLFSRTRDFHRAFADALSLADTALVLDVYPAREEPIPGVSSRLITDALNTSGGPAEPGTAPAALASAAAPGDIVMTLGAGDVTALGGDIVAALRERA